jgi:hypothetical protein
VEALPGCVPGRETVVDKYCGVNFNAPPGFLRKTEAARRLKRETGGSTVVNKPPLFNRRRHRKVRLVREASIHTRFKPEHP